MGGYDSESIIEIKSQNYFVKGALWTSTGELYDFYKKLEICQRELKGTVEYKSYEINLELNITYNYLGQIEITGKYSEYTQLKTKLAFEIKSDQTYIQNTLNELEIIADKYGDNKGVKK